MVCPVLGVQKFGKGAVHPGRAGWSGWADPLGPGLGCVPREWGARLARATVLAVRAWRWYMCYAGGLLCTKNSRNVSFSTRSDLI